MCYVYRAEYIHSGGSSLVVRGSYLVDLSCDSCITVHGINNVKFLVFKLSPCSKCNLFLFG